MAAARRSAAAGRRGLGRLWTEALNRVGVTCTLIFGYAAGLSPLTNAMSNKPLSPGF